LFDERCIELNLLVSVLVLLIGKRRGDALGLLLAAGIQALEYGGSTTRTTIRAICIFKKKHFAILVSGAPVAGLGYRSKILIVPV